MNVSIAYKALLPGAFLLLATLPAAAQTATSKGAACPRPAAGSDVLPPPSLYSAGGVLTVNANYQTALDAQSRTLFCISTTSGDESPVLHVLPGDTLKLTLTNTVPPPKRNTPTQTVSTSTNTCGSATMTETSTNIHFHGTNTSPACHGDQVIHTIVNSGETFTYSMPIPADEPAGLYWYHPHVHGIAEAAVQGGATGTIIVEGIERFYPDLAGLPERVLILRDQVVAPGTPAPGGAVPSWDVSLNYVPVVYPASTPAVIRMAGHGKEFWRVANSSADSVFDLQVLYDGVVQTLDVRVLDGVPTGSQDGTRTGKAVKADHILMATGARAEFVIPPPPAGTKSAILRTNNIDTGPIGDNDPTRILASLSFDDAKAQALRTIPASTGPAGPQRFEGLANSGVTATRKLYFSEILSDPTNPASPTNFYITVDGAQPVLFDPTNPPAITTKVGAVEDWTIENRAGEVHEFHMHQIHFLLRATNGQPVALDQQQLLDTVNIPYWDGKGPYPSVKVRMDFRGMIAGDLVYHCHILGHEDNGMMAIIRVAAGP